MQNWISQVVGKMHVNKITQIEVAKKMGVCNDYVSMILTGKKVLRMRNSVSTTPSTLFFPTARIV